MTRKELKEHNAKNMKTYPLDFVLKFAAAARDEDIRDLRAAIVRYEADYDRHLSDDFNFDILVDAICKRLHISRGEFFSKYKYGELPRARHFFCYILWRYNVKISTIARYLEHSPSRVKGAVNIVVRDYECERVLIAQILRLAGLEFFETVLIKVDQ